MTHYLTLPDTTPAGFDADAFLTLLEGSLSLTLHEKQSICAKVPHMTPGQITELKRVLIDEKAQYALLEKEKPEVLQQLYGIQQKELLRSQIELGQLSAVPNVPDDHS